MAVKIIQKFGDTVINESKVRETDLGLKVIELKDNDVDYTGLVYLEKFTLKINPNIIEGYYHCVWHRNGQIKTHEGFDLLESEKKFFTITKLITK